MFLDQADDHQASQDLVPFPSASHLVVPHQDLPSADGPVGGPVTPELEVKAPYFVRRGRSLAHRCRRAESTGYAPYHGQRGEGE